MVVNNPLVWPYFLRGWHVGGTLRSHEFQSHFMTSSLRGLVVTQELFSWIFTCALVRILNNNEAGVVCNSTSKDIFTHLTPRKKATKKVFHFQHILESNYYFLEPRLCQDSHNLIIEIQKHTSNFFLGCETQHFIEYLNLVVLEPWQFFLR